MDKEKAIKIIDNMYQNRFIESGVEDGNTIHIGNLDNLSFTDLESASILMLRIEQRQEKEINDLQQRIEKVVEYLEYQLSLLDTFKDEDIKAKMLGAMVLVILKGDDTNE